MRRNAVGLIWLAGIVLAVIVYQLGPDRMLFESVQVIDNLRDTINGVFAALAINTFDVLRALALGLLPVFAVLAALAQRRGLRIGRQVIVVAVLMLVLLYLPSRDGYYVSNPRWMLAFLVIAGGCLSVTRQLTRPQLPQSWPRP